MSYYVVLQFNMLVEEFLRIQKFFIILLRISLKNEKVNEGYIFILRCTLKIE